MNGLFSGSPLVQSFARAQRSSTAHTTPPSAEVDTSTPIVLPLPEIQHHDENAVLSPTAGTKRRIQQVSTKQTRKVVLEWMERWVQEQNTEKGLKAATVKQFPEHFRSSSNANIQKASGWWKNRHQFYRRLEKDKLSLERVQNSTVKKILLKARSGRGRKRAEWVEWVHKELLEEFRLL
ncbi:hypothetical protein P9112_011598 [Eukaryota sp. TZLM1-RC]